MWRIYFLELKKNDIYVGSTDDLRRRIADHNRGRVASTKPFIPPSLRSYVAVETELRARRIERCFKPRSGKAFAKKRFLAAI